MSTISDSIRTVRVGRRVFHNVTLTSEPPLFLRIEGTETYTETCARSHLNPYDISDYTPDTVPEGWPREALPRWNWRRLFGAETRPEARRSVTREVSLIVNYHTCNVRFSDGSAWAPPKALDLRS